MGLRFRKRLKIAPGVHVNISNKSISTSLGPRGATVNIGKRGVQATVGIPGTGLSYSQRLSAGVRVEQDESLSYTEYMKLPAVEKAAYQAAGGRVPVGVRLFKVVLWTLGIFFGVILLAALLAKSH